MAFEDYAAHRTTNLLERIMDNKDITNSNKKLVNDFLGFMHAKGLKDATIHKNLYCLVAYLKVLGKKDALTASREEIESALAMLDKTKYSGATKRNIKITLKVIYKHFLGEDMYYPRQIAWIKAEKSKDKKLMPKDILTEEEIMKMIETATNIRDKAIIALLFDSGIRIGELINMTKADVDLGSNPAHIAVNGKTGIRQVPIRFSVPYLAQYFNTIKKKPATDYLWTGLGTWAPKNRRSDRPGISKVLKEVAVKAGIHKRIYPHLFRHSRASYYANKLTEQQLKAFFGWTGASAMAATYVHLSGRDIDNAVMQANGEKPIDDIAKPKLKIKECERCQTPNTMEAIYCTRCGSPLDTDLAVKIVSQDEKLQEAISVSLSDPAVVKMLMPVLKGVLKERKGKK